MMRIPLPLAQVALSAMNHVLQQQPAARDQMRNQAGKYLRIVIGGPLGEVQSDAQIGPEGLLSVSTAATPSVVLTLSPSVSTVFSVLGGGHQALGPHLKVEGEVVLSATVAQVAQSLRWDYEEDLSRLVGDSLAHRVGLAVRYVQDRTLTLKERSREAIERTATGQQGPLVARVEMVAFADEVRRLAAAVARMEARRRTRGSSSRVASS